MSSTGRAHGAASAISFRRDAGESDTLNVMNGPSPNLTVVNDPQNGACARHRYLNISPCVPALMNPWLVEERARYMRLAWYKRRHGPRHTTRMLVDGFRRGAALSLTFSR